MKVLDADVTIGKPKEVQRASVLAVIIVLAAAILRFYHLGSQNLWIDEGFSLRDAARPDFLHETRPLYFLLLHYWLSLGIPHAEFWMRLPSALFGIGGVWTLYLVGRRLVGTSAALLASAFMAVSVLHINHSEEVRWYSLIVLLTLLTTYFLMLSLEEGKGRYFAAYALCGLASVMSFPLTAFTLAAQGVFALLYVKVYRPRSLVLLGLQGAVLLVWVPWLRNNMENAKGYSQGITSLKDMPNPVNSVAMLGKYFLWKWFNPGSVQLAAALGFSAFVLLIALYGLRNVRRTDAGAVFVWLWLVVPTVITLVACYKIANIWMPNYLICASPAFFLLVAKGIGSMRSRYAASAAVAVIMLVTFGRLGLYYRKPARPQWRSVVEYIQSHEKPGDVMGVYDPGNVYVLNYYYHGKASFAPLGDEALTSDRLHGWTDEKVGRLFNSFPLSGSRCWLVLCNHTIAGGFNITDYVQKHYRVLDHQSYNMVELYLFDAGGGPVPMDVLQSRGGK